MGGYKEFLRNVYQIHKTIFGQTQHGLDPLYAIPSIFLAFG